MVGFWLPKRTQGVPIIICWPFLASMTVKPPRGPLLRWKIAGDRCVNEAINISLAIQNLQLGISVWDCRCPNNQQDAWARIKPYSGEYVHH